MEGIEAAIRAVDAMVQRVPETGTDNHHVVIDVGEEMKCFAAQADPVQLMATVLASDSLPPAPWRWVALVGPGYVERTDDPAQVEAREGKLEQEPSRDTWFAIVAAAVTNTDLAVCTWKATLDKQAKGFEIDTTPFTVLSGDNAKVPPMLLMLAAAGGLGIEVTPT